MHTLIGYAGVVPHTKNCEMLIVFIAFYKVLTNMNKQIRVKLTRIIIINNFYIFI
jgi:hypothetical protein